MKIPKILNVINKNLHFFQSVLLLFSGFVVGLLFHFAPVIFSNENVFFYTFSTIAQSFVALVAFLGAIVVFKMQLIDQNVRRIIGGINIQLNYYAGPSEANTLDSDQVIDLIDKRIETDAHYRILRKNGDDLIKLRDERRILRRSMVDFTIWNFFVVSLSLLLLPVSSILTTGNFVYLGAFLISLNLTISVISLFYGYLLVRSVMGYDFELSI